MQLAAALDVSISKSTICIVERSDGSVAFETTVPTEPDEIVAALAPFANRLHLVGHETGSLVPWPLHRKLQKRGLPMVLVQTSQEHANLRAQRNKTDKTMRGPWRRWCAPADSSRCTSRAKRAFGCGCC